MNAAVRRVLPVRDYLAAAWLTMAAGIAFIAPWVRTWGPLPGVEEWDQIGIQAVMGTLLVSGGMLLRATRRKWACALCGGLWALVCAGYVYTDWIALGLLLSATMTVLLIGSMFERRGPR